jgi:hypothetical protein
VLDWERWEVGCTFVFVDAENDDDFFAADADEFLDGADAAAREFGKEDEAGGVLVFGESDIGS